MKKITLLLLITVLTIFTAACGNSNTSTSTKDPNKLAIYTTVYPLQYFAERIGGDHVEVASIYPPGSNEHTFEPTQQDMIHLADADLFFYIGLGLEGFVTNAKKTLASENVDLVETTATISHEKLAVSTSTKEDEHEEDGHTEDEHEEEGHEDHNHGATDPHVWISPVLSQDLATSIKDSLVAKDAKNKETYEKNYQALLTDLQELDTQFKTLAEQANQKTFFVSHASFGYIAGTYGLDQQAIAGLNSQDEPSQQELTKIADQAKKADVKYILFEQNISSKLSEVIKNDIGADSLTVNNLSVLTKEDIAAKKDYLTIMEDNIKTFEKVLK